MIYPLVILALGAILVGFVNWPERYRSLGSFLGESPSLQLAHSIARDAYPNLVPPVPFGAKEVDEKVHDVMLYQQYRMMGVSLLVFAMGVYVAYLLHRKYRERGEALPLRFPLINRLVENKFYVDEIYQGFIVEPLRWLGRAFFGNDNYVIDGLIWTASFIPQLSGFSLKLTTQRGSLQGYALLMLVAIAVILLVIFL